MAECVAHEWMKIFQFKIKTFFFLPFWFLLFSFWHLKSSFFYCFPFSHAFWVLLYLHFHHSVQLLSCVWLLATTWTSAHQASLSLTNSQSLLKLTSIESVMPSNHLILCRPLLLLPSIFPIIRVFSKEPVRRIRFHKVSQSIAASAAASVLPMNIQDWFPLGWTGWISLKSKGLSRVFSNTTVQKNQFFSSQLSL